MMKKKELGEKEKEPGATRWQQQQHRLVRRTPLLLASTWHQQRTTKRVPGFGPARPVLTQLASLTQVRREALATCWSYRSSDVYNE